MFDHIVPCGIADKGVTSLARLLGDAAARCATVVDAVVRPRSPTRFGYAAVDRQDARPGAALDRDARTAALVARRPRRTEPVRLLGRLAEAGVDGAGARPDVPPAGVDEGAAPTSGRATASTKRLMRDLDLHTVCEEAGCPNIYECWADRTATFMILGERCTRACGFCLVDTRHPLPLDVEEPARVADAVATLGLAHAVITSVARDDLADGGAAGFAATIRGDPRPHARDARSRC